MLRWNMDPICNRADRWPWPLRCGGECVSECQPMGRGENWGVALSVKFWRTHHLELFKDCLLTILGWWWRDGGDDDDADGDGDRDRADDRADDHDDHLQRLFFASTIRFDVAIRTFCSVEVAKSIYARHKVKAIQLRSVNFDGVCVVGILQFLQRSRGRGNVFAFGCRRYWFWTPVEPLTVVEAGLSVEKVPESWAF